jgi:aerobic C4-dicarboxylate transport protein
MSVATHDAGRGWRWPPLYVQVLAGLALGALLGATEPQWATAMKPFGDAFLKLIRMLIPLIVFCTVVSGIAKMGYLKEVGRVGLKALAYFTGLTFVALLIGLAVGNLVRPGDGMNIDPASLDAASVSSYVRAAEKHDGVAGFLIGIIPDNVVGAFAHGEILPVLFFSVLLALALATLKGSVPVVTDGIEQLSRALFTVVNWIMRLAPLGAFGAIAFAVGKFGVGTLLSLAQLMLAFYITCFVFIAVVLGLVAQLCGFSLWKLLRYLREELFVVLGTATTESVFPRMLLKLERLGCARPVVGLVLPAGYSFNLDGSCIYLTMAVLFIAQATNTPLDAWQQIVILAVLMVNSKGTAAVAGGGFIVLAATLSSTHWLPVAGLALLLGVDRFMAEARALTSLIGNAVATIAVAKWEGELDAVRMRAVLDGQADPETEAQPDKGPVPALA